MGIKSLSCATLPVKVMLSVIAFPKVTSPLAVNAPVMAVVALFRVTVPVAAPILKVVAAPPMFSVVAVALIRLKVVAAVTMSPPSTAKSLVTPNPPRVLIEPVLPEVESVVFATVIKPAELTSVGVDEPTDSIAPGAVLPIPTLPLFCRNKTLELLAASPEGHLWKFSVPLSKMFKVWAVTDPRNLQLAEREAEKVTSSAARGVVVKLQTLRPEAQRKRKVKHHG